MITEPVRGRSGQLVIAMHEFTKSTDHEDAQLIWRSEPNPMIGPILSVRAFEFEGQYGVDIIVPSTECSKQECVGLRVASAQCNYAGTKVILVLQKNAGSAGEDRSREGEHTRIWHLVSWVINNEQRRQGASVIENLIFSEAQTRLPRSRLCVLLVDM